MNKAVFIAFVIIACACCFQAADGNSVRVDSLRRVLNSAVHDTLRLDALNELCWEFRRNDPDTAHAFGRVALELGNRIQGDRVQFKLGKTYNNIGVVYWLEGKYPQAIDMMFKAVKVYEQFDDAAGMSGSYGNLALIYRNQGELDKALEYLIRSKDIQESHNDLDGMAKSLSNIGIIHANKGDYDRALECFMDAMKIEERLGITDQLAASYNNIGNIYYYKEEPDQCIAYQLKAIPLQRLSGDNTGTSISFLNIGSILGEEGKYKEAITHLDSAILYGGLAGFKEAVKAAYQAKATSYFELGEYGEAVVCYKRFSALNDTLFSEKKSKEIGKLEGQYEMEKKAATEKRMAEETVRIRAEKAERRNHMQYSAILMFIVALGMGIMISAKFRMPVRVIEGFVFFTFLLVFEFLLVLLDPYLEAYSGNEPAYKLLYNAVLAGLIFPFHSFFEQLMKKKLFRI